MAEEFAFEQSLGQGCTIDSEKWFRRTRAVQMNRVCRQLLPGSAFTANQNGRVRRRDLSNEFIYSPHRRALADHLVFNLALLLQALVFIFQPLDLPRIRERDGGDTGNRGQ